MNLSPNLKITLEDKSLSSVPLEQGSAGFIMASQWGPVNKAMSITNTANLNKMYKNPTYLTNHITYNVISRYLNYNVGGAKVVRAGKDDWTSKNAIQMFTADLNATASGDWNNGTNQFRKLNSEDDSYESSELTIVEISGADPSASPSVGDVLYKNGETSVYGTIEAIILVAENSGANSYVYIKNVTGNLYDGSNLSFRLNNAGGTEVIPAGEAVTTQTIYNTYFAEAELTVGASEIDVVAIGSTITQGVATAKVIGKTGTTKLLISDISGTFTATTLDKVDDITYAGSPVTVASIDSTSAIAQVLSFHAKYPGSGGNDIQVALCNKNDFGEAYSGSETFSSLFEVTALEDDEVAVVVTYDGDVVESWICSLDTTATVQGGGSKFIDDFLDDNSDYIGSESVTTGTHVVSDINDLTATNGNFGLTSLVGGASTAITDTEAETAYDVLIKKASGVYTMADFHELSDMSAYGSLMSAVASKIANLNRIKLELTLAKDDISATAFNISQVDTSISAINNKYVQMAYEWTYVTDRILKKKYWVPLTGDHMALDLKTIKEVGDWYAPFGVQNGILQDVGRLYYNFEEGDDSAVSTLYKYGYNADVYREDATGNQGYYLWGNRTKFNPASDLSRKNVVNSLLTDMKKLDALLAPFISLPIDENLFATVRQTCDAGYLQARSVNAYYQGDGDNGYSFICDSSNNDSQTASEKTLVVDFKVKYKPCVEFISLTISVTSTGIDFELV